MLCYFRADDLLKDVTADQPRNDKSQGKDKSLHFLQFRFFRAMDTSFEVIRFKHHLLKRLIYHRDTEITEETVVGERHWPTL